MAPKNKFTKEEMVEAALRVVRSKGIGGLTSTQPVFTAFKSMDGVKQEVYAAAVRVYDGYTNAGLQEKIPFLGVGMQYIRFAREEPELYRLLFLTKPTEKEHSAMKAMGHLQELIVTGDCPYSDLEIGQILTGFSISICKSIKEIPGFAAGTFDRDTAFRALVSE